MRLRIDRASAKLFEACTESPATPNSHRRHFFIAQEPYRVILVCRNGLELNHLVGQVVDVLVSRERGELPFVREANVGLQHTLITLYGVLPDAPPEKALAQVLAAERGRRNEEAHGEQGTQEQKSENPIRATRPSD